MIWVEDGRLLSLETQATDENGLASRPGIPRWVAFPSGRNNEPAAWRRPGSKQFKFSCKPTASIISSMKNGCSCLMPSSRTGRLGTVTTMPMPGRQARWPEAFSAATAFAPWRG